MSIFDNLIEDIAGRFDLGSKAGPLLRELLMQITSSPGGIGGFIDKFKAAGLGPEAASWLGNSNGVALSAPQVEKALGSTMVDKIARKVGLNGAAVSSAIGYLAPKVVGQLTPNGTIGAGIPDSVSNFLGATAPKAAKAATAAAARGVSEASAASGSMAKWLAPLVAGLAVLGLAWHLLSNTPATEPTGVASALPTSGLSISNNNGVVTYSGTVRDEATRSSIIDAMKAAFGGNAIKGDIAVNPNAPATPWLPNLQTALQQLKTPGVEATFDNSSVSLGGAIPSSERDRIMAALRPLLGGSLALGSLTDKLDAMITGSINKTEAALSALPAGFTPNDLTNVLNQSIINFPTGSAEIPAASKALLQQAAAPFKKLPSGTVIEIGGYTDNTGDPTANVALSQQRADAVRNALIQGGADPSMLVAKGYGSANPIASNDTADGRFQNRRIEYRAMQKS